MRRYLFGEEAKTRWGGGRGVVGKMDVLWFRFRRNTGQEALSLDNPVDNDYSQLLLTTGFFLQKNFDFFLRHF